MRIFLVYRQLPGLTTKELGALHRALSEAARRAAADGQHVAYLRSTYVPAKSQCLCVFTARSPEAVARVNEIAQAPFGSIEEAHEVSAEMSAP